MTMESQFWRERWQQGAIAFHQPQVNADLQAHWPRLKCPKSASVFVPLCGKSVDMVWLRAQGHQVIGVELSELAVAAFFAEQQLQPVRVRAGPLERWSAAGYQLYVGDFFELGAAQLAGVHCVYDRAALIALPPPLRTRYAQHLSALLGAADKILLLTMNYPQQQMPGPPFAVSEAEVRRLFVPDFSVTRIASRDALLEEPRFQQRGLTSRDEEAYLLERLDGALAAARRPADSGAGRNQP
jgi:thiopurine S-methyltransferase